MTPVSLQGRWRRSLGRLCCPLRYGGSHGRCWGGGRGCADPAGTGQTRPECSAGRNASAVRRWRAGVAAELLIALLELHRTGANRRQIAAAQAAAQRRTTRRFKKLSGSGRASRPGKVMPGSTPWLLKQHRAERNKCSSGPTSYLLTHSDNNEA